MDKLRIVLVDDHEVVRLGLRSLLERQPDLMVIGEAETADEAVRAVESLAPDVVVLDIRLPGRSGVEACAEIKRRRPETKIVMLTSYAEDEVLLDAIAAGAEGYVLKQVGSDDLVQALRRVGRGERLLDARLSAGTGG
jgi:DNA-binding NarL/FixJ family response regulator